jgi:hypothetical protein
MLARDGHRVTVLEADRDSPPPAPAAAWERWQRKGVAQFRQPHNVFPRFRQVCDEELPELPGWLAAAGCRWVDPLGAPASGGPSPPSLSDHEPRSGDGAFRMITGFACYTRYFTGPSQPVMAGPVLTQARRSGRACLRGIRR